MAGGFDSLSGLWNGQFTFPRVYEPEFFTANLLETADFLGSQRPLRKRTLETDQSHALFEWVDGPLVEAMKQGYLFLLDEVGVPSPHTHRTHRTHEKGPG